MGEGAAVDPVFVVVISAQEEGERLDRILSGRQLGYSRSTWQRWIAEGRVLVDGQAGRSAMRPRQGTRVTVRPAPAPPSAAQPQDIPLDVLFEDDHLLVLNKPAGMVVHPAPGHPDRTLVNALRFRGLFLEDADQARPGIVHRLDKDTSGVLVVAKRVQVREDLIGQFQTHSIEREYRALVLGSPPPSIVFDTLHGRHPVRRKRFTCRIDKGKRAITHVRLLERLHASAFVACRLETGRTHQIRVHLSEHGYPVLGDKTYGRSPRDPRLRAAMSAVGRQALHAGVLGFQHPATHSWLRFEAGLPPEFQRAVDMLRDAQSG